MMKKVCPSDTFDYWEFRWTGFDTTRVEFSKGKQVNRKKIRITEPVTYGFYVQCAPAGCFNYIVAIKNSKTIVIDSDTAFRRFIGSIDNLEEALLIVKLNDLWTNPEFKKTNLYKKTDKGYDFYLGAYESCPETFYSVHATLSYEGELKLHSKEIMKKTGNCSITFLLENSCFLSQIEFTDR